MAMRLNVELHSEFGGIDGDCGKLLRARLDDNGRIGEEVNAFLDQHHMTPLTQRFS